MTVKLRSKLMSLWMQSKHQTATSAEQLNNKAPNHQGMSGGYKHSSGKKMRRKKNH